MEYCCYWFTYFILDLRINVPPKPAFDLLVHQAESLKEASDVHLGFCYLYDLNYIPYRSSWCLILR